MNIVNTSQRWDRALCYQAGQQKQLAETRHDDVHKNTIPIKRCPQAYNTHHCNSNEHHVCIEFPTQASMPVAQVNNSQETFLRVDI